MAESGRIHQSSGPSATGTLQAQPTSPLSASKSASDAPYVPPHRKWDQIRSLRFTAMKNGEPWYLISHVWHEKWKAACNPASKTNGRGADEQLGPVDNSDIVDVNGELIPALSDGNRVISISQRAMELFTQWYILFCISPLYPVHAPPIAGMVLQSIPFVVESSPRAIIRQSASNFILTR